MVSIHSDVWGMTPPIGWGKEGWLGVAEVVLTKEFAEDGAEGEVTGSEYVLNLPRVKRYVRRERVNQFTGKKGRLKRGTLTYRFIPLGGDTREKH